MNEFFKYLLPQLLAYFHDNKVLVDSFIPDVIKEYYKDLSSHNSNNIKNNHVDDCDSSISNDE